MDFYNSELNALKRNKILRKRKVYCEFGAESCEKGCESKKPLADFASNDYLGLSNRADSLRKAYKLTTNPTLSAPRASMLVNGYSKLHRRLERRLANLNGFESCILAGSGFLANIALIESLVRKGDKIFIDEEYHASGILASRLVQGVEFFRHNDCADLKKKILSSLQGKSQDLHESTKKTRILIAIEGIYSMSGDIAPKGFAQIAQKYNAILIVDEAHSSGTLGQNLLGYFDYHHIKIAPNFIKLGTFSKALGSYGAYICCSNHIHNYLQTRAKPIIYSTALSAFDSALALTNLNFIHQNRARFARKIAKIKKIIQKNLKIKLDSQIFSIQFQSQNEMLKTFRFLKKHGILVGAIRKPSVKIPQLRIILSTKHKKKDIIALCKLLKK